MTQQEFDALVAATDLDALSWEELVAFNTELSGLREEAGGTLRRNIYTYALTVNAKISARHVERAALRVASRSLVEKALLQTVAPGSFKGELEKLLK